MFFPLLFWAFLDVSYFFTNFSDSGQKNFPLKKFHAHLTHEDVGESMHHKMLLSILVSFFICLFLSQLLSNLLLALSTLEGTSWVKILKSILFRKNFFNPNVGSPTVGLSAAEVHCHARHELRIIRLEYSVRFSLS